MTRTVGIRRVNICGQQLQVHVRVGDGTGYPILMCGGLGAGLEVLQPLTDALDPGIEVIRFDAPGIGGSSASALPYSFPRLVCLIGALLDELGYQQVDVLGYSWGGALAQQLALQDPGRCRRLVLLSTSTGMLSVPGRPADVLKMFQPRYVREPEAVGVMGGIGYFHQLAAMAVWTSLPFLSAISQPTLIVAGDADSIVPVANARMMSSLIPRSTLHIYRGGHLGIVSVATELGRVVTQFLN